MPGVIEWGLAPWTPEAWRKIDQPPAFLNAFRDGDYVLTLSGEFVTTVGVNGVGPTAASDFVLALVQALCVRAGAVLIDLDLGSRPGMRTDELRELTDAVAPPESAKPLGDGHWLVSLKCGSRLGEWIGPLIGSNLDYRLDFGTVRLAERDAAIVVIAGHPDAVGDVQALVEDVARAVSVDLRPFGWDLGEA